MLLEFFAGLTALGALVTAAGVLVAVRQVKASETNVRQAEKLAQADFEDDLAREYRQIVHQLPAVAFYETGHLELDDELRKAFYRYFDLSNEQLYLADRARVSERTAGHWRDGIGRTLRLPVFAAAWEEIAPRIPADAFEHLRRLSG